jgi:hypothetical protein
MSEMESRKEFEAWAKATGKSLSSYAMTDGTWQYVYDTEQAWKVWQASRAALQQELDQLKKLAKQSRIGLWTAKEMRSCFEKWAVAEWGWDATDFGRSDDGEYIWPECDAAWDGWKGCYKRSGLDVYNRLELDQLRAEIERLKG